MDLIERIKDSRGTDDWHQNAQRRQAEVASEIPVPFCCPLIAGARVVWPNGNTFPPEWHASYPAHNTDLVSTVAKNCPFCGTVLPRLVLKANPPPRTRLSGSRGCLTCGETQPYCFCSSPLSRYEVEGAPPLFAVVAIVRHDGKYLSVSRKHNPNDLGFPGGKIDPGETPQQALVRELQEETGLLAHEFHSVFDAVDATGPKGKRCLAFEVTRYSGQLSTRETGVIRWSTDQELTAPGQTFEPYNRALFLHTNPYGFLS